MLPPSEPLFAAPYTIENCFSDADRRRFVECGRVTRDMSTKVSRAERVFQKFRCKSVSTISALTPFVPLMPAMPSQIPVLGAAPRQTKLFPRLPKLTPPIEVAARPSTALLKDGACGPHAVKDSLRLRPGSPQASCAALRAAWVIPLPGLRPVTAIPPLIGAGLVKFAAANLLSKTEGRTAVAIRNTE